EGHLPCPGERGHRDGEQPSRRRLEVATAQQRARGHLRVVAISRSSGAQNTFRACRLASLGAAWSATNVADERTISYALRRWPRNRCQNSLAPLVPAIVSRSPT